MVHPLDPLGAEEIEKAAAVVRAQLGPLARFETIALEEPQKSELKSGGAIPRRAFVCCYDPETNLTSEGIVNLDDARLEIWRGIEAVQARIVADEFTMGGEIARADPRFIAACARRGITDMSQTYSP